MDSIVALIENKLNQHNKKVKVTPINIIISSSVAKNIMHIVQALDCQRGHVIIIGDAGSGRRSCALVSSLILNYEVYQVLNHITVGLISLF